MLKKTLAGLALGLTLTGALAQDINFGIISTESTQNLKADWQPLLDDMAAPLIEAILPATSPCSCRRTASEAPAVKPGRKRPKPSEAMAKPVLIP